MSEIDVRLNEPESRFEAIVEQNRCVLDFTLDGNVISMNHVGVPDAVGGRGIAGEITRYALDWSRDQGFRVKPNCPYVAAWIKRHPEYSDLVAG